MPLTLQPSQEGTPHRSEPAPRAARLAARDHRDDGSLLGGLAVMLSAALPFWIMAIILLASLLR